MPSAEHLFDVSQSNADASIGFGDNSPDDQVIEQYPFYFPEWFSYDTNTDFLSMEMGPDIIAETYDDHQNSRSEMAPPRRRRYMEEEENDYKKRLYELESLYGPGHPATLHVHLNLAIVLIDQGRYRAAELSYRQVLSTSQRFLEKDHELAFMAVEGLIYTFFCQERHSSAEKYYRSLQRRALKVLGREHDVTLLISHHMGRLLSDIGKYNEALLLKQEAFETYSKKYGLEDWHTILAMQDLAIVLFYTDEVEKAKRLLRDVIRFREKHPLDNIGIIYSKLLLAGIKTKECRLEESEKMHREVIKLWKSSLGPEHSDTLLAMRRLADMLDMQKRHAESKKMNLEILAGRTKVLGPSHPYTEAVQRALVSALSPSSIQVADIYNLQNRTKE